MSTFSFKCMNFYFWSIIRVEHRDLSFFNRCNQNEVRDVLNYKLVLKKKTLFKKLWFALDIWIRHYKCGCFCAIKMSIRQQQKNSKQLRLKNQMYTYNFFFNDNNLKCRVNQMCFPVCIYKSENDGQSHHDLETLIWIQYIFSKNKRFCVLFDGRLFDKICDRCCATFCYWFWSS